MDEALYELDSSFLPGALSSVVANNIWSFIIASLARIAMFKSTRFIAYATPTQSPTLKNECEVQRTVTKFFPTIGKILSSNQKNSSQPSAKWGAWIVVVRVIEWFTPQFRADLKNLRPQSLENFVSGASKTLNCRIPQTFAIVWETKISSGRFP